MEKKIMDFVSFLWNDYSDTSLWNTSKDTQWSIQAEDGLITIYFQGTNSTEDWLRDFDFDTDKWSAYGINVHCGFLKCWNDCKDDLITKFKETYKEGDKVVVAGYSLGAAIAKLCALEIGRIFDIEINRITIGCPRVGAKKADNAVLDAVCGLSRDYCNGSDVVTTVPNWYYAPVRNDVGEKWSNWKMITNGFDYHRGYNNPDLYKDEPSVELI